MQKHLLTSLSLSGALLGIIIGLLIRTTSKSPWNDREVMYIGFIGELFLRMLMAVTVPSIIFSLIASISYMNMSKFGRIGYYAMIYYVLTTALAVTLAVLLAVTIEPGIHRDFGPPLVPRNINATSITTKDTIGEFFVTLVDLLRNMFLSSSVEDSLTETEPSDYDNSG